MLKVSPSNGVICFGKRGKLNLRYIGPFRIISKVGTLAYRLELPEQLRRVHSTFHVSNMKKCFVDEPLAIPLDEIQIDDKLHFIKEPRCSFPVTLHLRGSDLLLGETYTFLSHFNDSSPDYETFCFDIEEKSSGSTTSHSYHSLPEYESFCFDVDHIEEKSSGSTTSHSDLSLLEYESFHFDPSIDPLPPADRSDSHLEEFADELAHIISPPEYDHFYFDLKDISSLDPPESTPVIDESTLLVTPLPDFKEISLREVERFDLFFSLTQSGEKTRVMETLSFGFHHMPSPRPAAYSPTEEKFSIEQEAQTQHSGVSLYTRINHNILFMELLEKQGFDVGYDGNRCTLFPMFKDKKIHHFDEDKMRKMQNKYLQDYFESIANKDGMEQDTVRIKGNLYCKVGEIMGLPKGNGEEIRRCYMNYLEILTSHLKTARAPLKAHTCAPLGTCMESRDRQRRNYTVPSSSKVKERNYASRQQAVVISQSSPKESTHKGFHLGRKNVG
ncbi:hypothetical protein Tco_1555371 [Tanacetum coccineum]